MKFVPFWEEAVGLWHRARYMTEEALSAETGAIQRQVQRHPCRRKDHPGRRPGQWTWPLERRQGHRQYGQWHLGECRHRSRRSKKLLATGSNLSPCSLCLLGVKGPLGTISWGGRCSRKLRQVVLDPSCSRPAWCGSFGHPTVNSVMVSGGMLKSSVVTLGTILSWIGTRSWKNVVLLRAL